MQILPIEKSKDLSRVQNLISIEDSRDLKSFLDQFSKNKIHLMGASSQELRAVFQYLYKTLGYRNIVLHDFYTKSEYEKEFARFDDTMTSEQITKEMEDLENSGLEFNFKENYGNGINNGDLVIFAQAYFRYPINDPIIKMSKQGKITTIQAMEMIFKVSKCKTLGITGTLGKTTVTEMIYKIFKTAKINCYRSGNDRESRWNLEKLSKLGKDDWAIIEVSNRHLKDLKQSPSIAVLTNLSPHHLDDHKTYRQYIYDKTNIFRYQTSKDFAVINQKIIDEGLINFNDFKTNFYSFKLRPFEGDTDYKTREISVFETSKNKGCSNHHKTCPGSTEVATRSERSRRIKIIDVKDLYLPSEFVAENALAAAIACHLAGINSEVIGKGLKAFRGVKYRMEYIGVIKGHNIYNDGKSTDPVGTLAALKSAYGPKTLIIGGIREGLKKGDFDELGQELLKSGADLVIYGSSRNKIAKDIKKYIKSYFVVETLEEAVERAFKISQKDAVIIYSPACQSMDQFKDYRERSIKFNELIKIESRNKN